MAKVDQQSTSAVDISQARDALRAVTDPELGANIVDLGLIYAIEINRLAIYVRMTMTTPGRPMSGMMADDVRMVLAHRFPRHWVDVDLIWEPRWQLNMISPIARLELGLAR